MGTLNNCRARLLRSLRAPLFACVIVVAGCATQENDSSTNKAMVHSIVLAAPTDKERTLRAGTKGEPLQVGFGREIPTAQRRVVLRDLQWRTIAGGYATTLSVQSPGARELRVGMRLNKNVAGLEFGFRGSNTVPASAIANVGDPYWSPVINGDTLWIELKATTLPSADVVLELPVVSHIS